VAIFGAVLASGEFITGLRASLGGTAVVLIVLVVASLVLQRRRHTAA
jgi:DHA2 family methylenomycin A resistance protein-like MFS transporter